MDFVSLTIIFFEFSTSSQKKKKNNRRYNCFPVLRKYLKGENEKYENNMTKHHDRIRLFYHNTKNQYSCIQVESGVIYTYFF